MFHQRRGRHARHAAWDERNRQWHNHDPGTAVVHILSFPVGDVCDTCARYVCHRFLSVLVLRSASGSHGSRRSQREQKGCSGSRTGAAPPAFPDVLGAVAEGVFVPMEEIPDPTFSQGVLGVCCGVEPAAGKVYSPMDGKISTLADTLHALGIEADGVELLIHVGIDTVAMKGDGFKAHVKEGQTVKKGDLLLTMDLEKIRAAGHPATIMVAVTNSDDLASVEAVASGQLKPGDRLMCLKA